MEKSKKKLKIIHLTIVRKLSPGQINQLSYEIESKKRIDGAIWETFSYHNGISNRNWIKRIPFLFQPLFIRNIYGWIKAIYLSKKCDFLLMRHMTFDPFALIFSPFIKNRISIHHSKESFELKLVAPGWRGRAAATLESITGRVAARNALALLGVTGEIAEYECYAHGVKKPVFVYPNGIVPADIRLLEDERRDGEINAAFMCGHFSSWHGLDKLVDAVIKGQSDASETPVIFHLIGILSPEQLQDIAKINNPQAMFKCHGLLAEEHYRKILNRCDIGIASLALERKGLKEASSLKVREMLAMGLPIVSGHRDVVMSDDIADYFVLDEITLQKLRDIAASKKKESRSTVRKRNIDKISKLQAMQRVAEFCRTLG